MGACQPNFGASGRSGCHGRVRLDPVNARSGGHDWALVSPVLRPQGHCPKPLHYSLQLCSDLHFSEPGCGGTVLGAQLCGPRDAVPNFCIIYFNCTQISSFPEPRRGGAVLGEEMLVSPHCLFFPDLGRKLFFYTGAPKTFLIRVFPLRQLSSLGKPRPSKLS